MSINNNKQKLPDNATETQFKTNDPRHNWKVEAAAFILHCLNFVSFLLNLHLVLFLKTIFPHKKREMDRMDNAVWQDREVKFDIFNV